MKDKIVNKTKKDSSNSFHIISHTELLKLAGVKIFEGSVKIEYLSNGRIIVKEKKED